MTSSLTQHCTFFGKYLRRDSKTAKLYIDNIIELQYLLGPTFTTSDITEMSIKLYEEMIKKIPDLEKDLHRLSYGNSIINILLQALGGKPQVPTKKIDLEELTKAPESVREEALSELLKIGGGERSRFSLLKTPLVK